jgi:phosphotriesterase-related protein
VVEKTVSRREFVECLVPAMAMPLQAAGKASPAAGLEERLVMTVRGPLPASQMGITLPHEHVLVDFIGADKVSPDRYKKDEVIGKVLAYLKEAKSLGVSTLCECTPAYLGRDPVLLKRLSELSGLHLLTNTGLYGAGSDRYLPPYAFKEAAEQLAKRWIQEWESGIEGTGIRPGFVKIGVDPGPLSAVDEKLVRAAAQVHLATGLVVAVHAADDKSPRGVVRAFEAEGAPLHGLIWVHAQNAADRTLAVALGQKGVWVEFDGLSTEAVAQHVELVQRMKDAGLLHRTLVSQDAGWYEVGAPGGGKFRPYRTLLVEFVPALTKSGFTDREIRQLIVLNPQAAFSIRKQ